MKVRVMTLGAAAMIALAAFAGYAQGPQASPTPLPLAMVSDDDKRLAPIAPELRDAARRAISITQRQGTIDEKMVLASRNRPGSFRGAPRLPDVPVTEMKIPGPQGAPEVKIFVINTKPGAQRPGILHTHGGGFILGTAATDIRRLQELAIELDCVVITVEYRLAPETGYRGSIEDTYAGLSWMYDHASEIGLDRSRIAVTGESAGGGHAALLAITARDRGRIPILFQALVYPMLDDRTGGAVRMPPHIATVGWSGSENQYGWRAFLGQQPGTRRVPARAVPARTKSLAGLPPAFIEVGGADLFVSEDIDYARRLNEAGVPTELLVVPGAFHGFDQLAPDAPQSRHFRAARVEALRRAFAAGR